MLASTHKLTEALTAAIAPVLRKHPDYPTITQAIALVVARIAQSTPDKGKEEEQLNAIFDTASDALDQFLQIEANALAEKTTLKTQVVGAINGFERFAAIEPGSAEDNPQNSHFPQIKESRFTKPGPRLFEAEEFTPGEGAYREDPQPEEGSEGEPGSQAPPEA